MIVVLSDLHFREEKSDLIRLPGRDQIGRRRNLAPKPYERFIQTLAEQAVAKGRGRAGGAAGTQRLDLVLAGDIFDVQRTACWFNDGKPGPMPYDPAPAPGEPLEKKTLEVLDAIAAEKWVGQTLELFRLLTQQGEYVTGPESTDPFPADEVRVHYVPGNHDRLCNATPALRRWVRRALGMPESDDPFPHHILFDDPRVLVRHGHEYDPRAFGTDYSKGELPDPIPAEAYAEPALGDFVGVQIAARLPYEFRAHYGDERIADTPLLAKVYDRLMQFDDVRPQSALVRFLVTDPAVQGEEDEAWAAVEPVLRKILDSLRKDPFLRAWLRKKDRPWVPDRQDLLQAALDLAPWSHGLLTREVAEKLISEGERPRPPVEYAAREPALRSGRAQFVVAGHTHEPAVELAQAYANADRYYIDTGTWRNRVPTAPLGQGFGRLKALSYVILWGSTEDPSDDGKPKQASFDYWSGFTQRWV